jgi:proteic killer suppression protein
MIKSFRNKVTRDLFRQVKVKKQWRSFTRIARRKLDAVHAATQLADLRGAGHRLEKLRGDRQGQHSIRINDQWRVCFRWRNGDAYDVEMTDDH